MAENNLVELKSALKTDAVKVKFFDMLGSKSAGFLTSIMNVVQNNALLQKADTNSILLAAAQAASLDLPINPNLGFSAIIPFNDTRNHKCVATFQIMRDGWVELCLRTGQFEYIVNEPVYEGELVEKNRFTDTYIFDESKRTSDKIIGYMAAFKLTNGYKKTLFMTIDEVKEHGKKYSQTFRNNKGLWIDAFDAMARKTCLKLLLKKYAPKSIDVISKAVLSDQATFSGSLDNPQIDYVDNKTTTAPIVAEQTEFEEVDTETGEVKQEQDVQPKENNDLDF